MVRNRVIGVALAAMAAIGLSGCARDTVEVQEGFFGARGIEEPRAALLARTPVRPERLASPWFQQARPFDLVIEQVEAIWAPIDQTDDWSRFAEALAAMEAMRTALDLQPEAARRSASAHPGADHRLG